MWEIACLHNETRIWKKTEHHNLDTNYFQIHLWKGKMRRQIYGDIVYSQETFQLLSKSTINSDACNTKRDRLKCSLWKLGQSGTFHPKSGNFCPWENQDAPQKSGILITLHVCGNTRKVTYQCISNITTSLTYQRNELSRYRISVLAYHSLTQTFLRCVVVHDKIGLEHALQYKNLCDSIPSWCDSKCLSTSQSAKVTFPCFHCFNTILDTNHQHANQSQLNAQMQHQLRKVGDICNE